MFYHESWQNDICSFRAMTVALTVSFKLIGFNMYIIYKQLNFCRFRALAYTNIDRLCAVFLYNTCCFHDFIETSTPISDISVF